MNILALILFVSLTAVAPASKTSVQPVLYVDDDAPLGGDGTSWQAAFRHLQDALHAARTRPGVSDIRIARGTYKPDLGAEVVPGDIHAAFDLVDRLALRGGYAGFGSPDPDARDWHRFDTILSGDLLGNDGPGFTNYSDNSYRVVRSVDLSISTLVEGFTITGAQRNVPNGLIGGGILCDRGGLRVQDCRFHFNFAYFGASIGNRAGTLEVRRCVFRDNQANYGPGVYAANLVGDPANVLLEDCAFINNAAIVEDGGGAYLNAIAVVRRCTFIGNSADDGGAIFGGPFTEDCTFVGNFADYGGAVFGAGTYVRCRFENNYGSAEGGAYVSIFDGVENHARFVGCQFIRNQVSSLRGGAAHGGAAFVGCLFVGNQAGTGSSGGFSSGGAIFARVPSVITDCAFIGNTTPSAGGAVSVPIGSSAVIVNVTFLQNAAVESGEAVSGPATICNSIFGPHDGPPLAGVTSVDYSCLPPAFPFAGGVGNIAADPRFVDPLGPDGIPGTEDDDLRLRSDSPCIDAGDSTALPADQFDLDGDGDVTEPLPIDMLGNRRVLFSAPHTSPPDTGVPDGTGAIIDMGAHEFRRPVDCAPATPPIGDGFVNIDDLLVVISGWGRCDPDAPCLADVNADGVVDIHDLLAVLTGWG